MTSSSAPRKRWHRVAFAVTTGALAISGSYGVFAGLNATGFNASATQVTTGTLKLTVDKTDPSAGFTTTIANLVPGDVVNRYVTLTNAGSLASQAMTFKVSTAAGDTPALITSAGTHKALQVSVQRCAVAWTSGACTDAGGAKTIINGTDLSGLANAVAFPVKDGVSDATMAAAEKAYLKVSVALPNQDESVSNGALPDGTVQAGTANLTFAFNELQATATTTNS